MSTDPIQLFRETWQTYRKVMRDNYMFHHEISRAISGKIDSLGKGLNVLDLGCGDAAQISEILDPDRIEGYTGCDLSPLALELAGSALSVLDCTVELIERDMLCVLEEVPPGRYNLLFSSLALHHLSPDGKRAFFGHCRRILPDEGCLILSDIMREEDETRPEYLEHYLAAVKNEWVDVSGEEYVRIEDHIRSCDFPEKASTLRQMASEAGFGSASRLEKRTWHQAWCYAP